MPSNRNDSGRNQRNNPYQIEELFVKFRRTPAGIAWRWRTELAVLAARCGGWIPCSPWTGQVPSWADWSPWS
jgi:hypothetical protein